MAESLITNLENHLNEGWTLEYKKAGAGRGIHQLLHKGVPVTDRGILVTITDNPSFTYKRQMVSRLRRLGAIPMHEKKKSPEPERTSVSHNTSHEVKTAVAMAREILKDVQSRPRERKMAKAYLDLLARYSRTLKLTKRLADRHAA
jgi:hypothetical protein